MTLVIDPPLLNSACPWATTEADLQGLYDCPHTGAITIRTSRLDGFANDPSIHQYAFFNPSSQTASADPSAPAPGADASMNSLGYSPIKLEEYLGYIKNIASKSKPQTQGGSANETDPKLQPIIISVTGTPEQVTECYRQITALQKEVEIPLAMEINLSCPNILNMPLPGYSSESLSTFLTALAYELERQRRHRKPAGSARSSGSASSFQTTGDNVAGWRRAVPIGLKMPPYTYAGQFEQMIAALAISTSLASPCPIAFLTATNTLGSCLVLSEHQDGKPFTPVLNTTSQAGIGGMAGAPLHPLALGNVKMLRELLDTNPDLAHIMIIGVGGVSDRAGFERMRHVGAGAVGLASALGRKGITVFKEILEG
ncbi:FMN-linked oxidoreductase [Eremomyces bilateralis CBS 781.70]|uniref:Dihydroorotate dehydrogenase (fumarate) n=1 Tax=Eremomyces bilateralis CBS 781.70 TaxID=1392243 RepID=A0A6G1GH60_9PEZI|nr:FMN-linked oxidoreductase [Eremomyces bilateralis CBS 781.70]KAF1817344.1 FMN-linked oxidoreductase [Eremomyces bilateralis CBS 781.70]